MAFVFENKPLKVDKMSARVFNPILVNELKHVRSPTANDCKANLSRGFAALSPIKRDLFGPVDHEECRLFVEGELAREQNLNMNYWEFDFINDVPRPGRGRFLWQATFEKTNIRPVKRECSETTSDISHLYHVPLEESSPEKEKLAAALVHLNKKQAKITGKHYTNNNITTKTFILFATTLGQITFYQFI